jgi:predicted O-methyltransferase YrrM
MKGSVLTKVTRVLAHLATHPRHLAPYVTRGPLCRRTPLELGVPWFAQSAIEFLEGHVTKAMHVFEYGSGGSTVFFARRAASVLSTEDNADWLDRVRAALAAERLTNARLQHHPYDFHHAAEFAQSAYLNSLPAASVDIIVVDGMEEVEPVRPQCFRLAETRIKPGGLIIVDDSWRYTELRTANRAKSWREFRSIGPCRPGVTSTDIYFY